MNSYRQSRIKPHLELRARLLEAIRRFFAENAYLEVETPVRIPSPAPETHIDALSSEAWYLQTSPELCMKRLLAAGYERVFQICKCFRRNERGRRHLPEMTMLEWYTAGVDYQHMMAQCQALMDAIVRHLGMGRFLNYQGHAIDLEPPWTRLSVAQAFARHGALSMEEALAADRFDEIMGLQIEPCLGWEHPVILYDYPAACGALARLKANQPEVAERFELYIGGLELCNAFSELTDPLEQRQRFEAELARRRAAGKAVYPMPEHFLASLPSMPPAAGNALGVDRLMMLLADTREIDEVVAFVPEEL